MLLSKYIGNFPDNSNQLNIAYLGLAVILRRVFQTNFRFLWRFENIFYNVSPMTLFDGAGGGIWNLTATYIPRVGILIIWSFNSARLRGITTEFVGFIPRSLMLKSIVLGWILIYRNWSIAKSISLPMPGDGAICPPPTPLGLDIDRCITVEVL